VRSRGPVLCATIRNPAVRQASLVQSKYCPLYTRPSLEDWQKLARRDPLAPAKNRVVKAAAAVVRSSASSLFWPNLRLRFRD